MGRDRGMGKGVSRRALAPLALAAVALPLALYLLAARDVRPDSASASPVMSIAVRPRLAGFAKLTALAGRLRHDQVMTSHRLPASYDEDPRAVDGLLDAELVRDLPHAVEEVLAPASVGAGEALVGPQSAEATWPPMLTIARLLSLQMQRQWARQDDNAWQIARLQLRFVRFLVGQARSFHELTSAETSCAVVLRALSSGIAAGRLSTPQLEELQDLPEPADLVAAVLDAARSESANFEAQLDRVRGQEGGLLGRLSFQPNRTRHAWLAAMSGPVQALQRGDLPAAYEDLAKVVTAGTGRQPRVRNSLGARLTTVSIQGILEALAQAIDLVADFRLLRSHAAVAAHRAHHGAQPLDLVGLLGQHQPRFAADPWAGGQPFHVAKQERIYSIGRDGRDDHGLFSRDFSYGGGALDLGLHLSKQ